MAMQQVHDDWEIVSRGSDAESSGSWALPEAPAVHGCVGAASVLTETPTSGFSQAAAALLMRGSSAGSPECGAESEGCGSEWTTPFGAFGDAFDPDALSEASSAPEAAGRRAAGGAGAEAVVQQQQRLRMRRQRDLAEHGFGQLGRVEGLVGRDLMPPQKSLQVRGSKGFQHCPRGKSAKQLFRQMQHRSAFTNQRKC